MQHINSIAAVPAVANMIVNLTMGALVANLFRYKFQHTGKAEASIL
jgi:BASS family bile acid:Na+ symporter